MGSSGCGQPEKSGRQAMYHPHEQILPAGILDELSTQQLRKLHDLLEDAKDKTTGLFGLTAFENAMKSVLGEDGDEGEIRQLFYKIDAKGMGRLSWTNFIDHIQQIYNQRDVSVSKSVSKPFRDDTKLYSCLEHFDAVISMKIYDVIEGHRDAAAGHYICASTAGYLMLWSPDMELTAKVHIQQGESEVTKQSVTVTDMACLPDAQMIAVSTTVWDIRFYESSPAEFERHFSIVDFPSCIMAVDYHIEGDETSVLLCGDTAGGISLITFHEIFFHNLRRSQIVKQRLSRIPFSNIERKAVQGIELAVFPFIHSNWVLKVKYIHSINAFLSCAACTREAMSLYDVIKGAHSLFRSPKGILCFDFSRRQNFIISGGMDYAVKIWNPYVQESPTCSLQGHMAPVVHIMVDDDRQFIMSVSKDKYIKVWHMTLHNCLQTINCSDIGLGQGNFTAAVFNKEKHTMIVATYQLAAFKALIVDDAIKYNTHSKAVCAALYNVVFNLVITGGEDSDVMVWDLTTGRKIFEFSKAHKIMSGGLEVPVEITAMRLDPTERRLVTAGRDGVIKVWNFNNGLCLKEFRTFGDTVITGIAFAGYHMFVAGWSRRINLFYDDGFESFQRVWDLKHAEDILGIDTYRGQLLATASYDGEIIIWIRENGFVKFRLRDQGIVKLKSSESTESTAEVESHAENEEKLENGHPEEEEEDEEVGEGKPEDEASSAPTEGQPKDDEDGDEVKEIEKDDAQSVGQASTEDFKQEATMSKIMFLQYRPIAPEVATLVSCGKDGFIKLWSVAPGSGLLGKFYGAKRDADSVLCLAADSKNKFLITGDTSGYVSVWQLEGYLDGVGKRPPGRLVELIMRFPFFRLQLVKEDRARKRKMESDSTDATPSTSNASLELGEDRPCLLNRFRAHLHSILHVEYVDDLDVMLTCGREGSVRMWTVGGQYIGAFGQKALWDLNNLPVYSRSSVRPMPAEIRYLASPTTFKVLNNGVCPRWSKALDLFMHAKLAGVMTFPWVKDDDKKKKVEVRTPKVRETGSPILGKYHVIRRRFHHPPELPPLRDINHKISLYHTFDIPSLEEVKPPVLSDYVRGAIKGSGLFHTKKKKQGRRRKSATAAGAGPTPNTAGKR